MAMITYRQKMERFKSANGVLMTPYKFVYESKSDLVKKYGEIFCLFLIESEQHGISIMEFKFRRIEYKTPKQWSAFLKDKGIAIYREAVLPSINNKTGDNWDLKKFIGFGKRGGLKYAFRESSNTNVLQQNQRTKKGSARVH